MEGKETGSGVGREGKGKGEDSVVCACRRKEGKRIEGMGHSSLWGEGKMRRGHVVLGGGLCGEGKGQCIVCVQEEKERECGYPLCVDKG